MKSIFEKTVREELALRIASLSTTHAAQWGKMNVYQMARHCTLWDTWVLGKHEGPNRRALLGLIFGRLALRNSVKDERPITKNVPTSRDLVIKESSGDLELQKQAWLQGLAEYGHFTNQGFVHDFFGKMTTEQIGIFAYKYADHHLRQFKA